MIHRWGYHGVPNSRAGRALVPGMAADGDFESHEPFERAMLRLRCVLTRCYTENTVYPYAITHRWKWPIEPRSPSCALELSVQ